MQGQEITQREYKEICDERDEQPYWRGTADKEMDYADGNQLDSELLRAQAARGIPPAVEDLIGPAMLALQGYEEKTRTDWRVTPDGDTGGQDVADALNYKLNQAERHSGADKAISKGFRSQIGCGIGWVEVSRNSDPFEFPYRCKSIHRNEIDWDMRSGDDPKDWRWLRRQRWMQPSRLAQVFPEHKDLIEACGTHGSSWTDQIATMMDGGVSTGLQNAWNEGRAWTMQEERWFNRTNKEVCCAELWYRRWVTVPVIKTPDGRVVEYDKENMAHAVAIAAGRVKPIMATISKVRRSYWLGQHLLADDPTPYAHRYFPYVPMFGFREDMTGIPYGYVRGMKYNQDSINSGISKLRWGMSVTRVERTKGAVAMTDEQFRRVIARPDADIILDQQEMAKPGATFKVHRDFQLTDQHYTMLNDNRAAIQRVGGAAGPAFQGRDGTATSGVQESTQVEQANQSLGTIMDNRSQARMLIGELLVSMIMEDMGTNQQTVVIEGDAVREDRTVVLNAPEIDPQTGLTYLSNDIQRTRLKVALEEVPSTNTYRAQQLNAMSEAVKALPTEYQAAMLPFMVGLMDLPYKSDVVTAIREVQAQSSPQAIEQRIKQAEADAVAKSGHDLKARELDMKERKAESEIKGIDATTLQTIVAAIFASMQAAGQIAMNPTIAPIADELMQAGGYQPPSPGGIDPNFPQPQQAGNLPIVGVESNTSPQFPAVPERGMAGIETTTTADNMGELA